MLKGRLGTIKLSGTVWYIEELSRVDAEENSSLLNAVFCTAHWNVTKICCKALGRSIYLPSILPTSSPGGSECVYPGKL